jgi:GxxExxY protein
VECKAIGQIGKPEIAQTLNYLKATGLERALVINFAPSSLE